MNPIPGRALLVLVLCLAGCSSVPKQRPADVSDIVATKAAEFSNAVIRASAAGWAAPEVEALVDLYSPDATLFPPDGPMLKGHEAIRAYWARAASRRILRHAVTVEHAESSGDLLYEYGTFTLTYQNDDAAPKEGSARYISVWRRDPRGQWRKHLDTWW